MLGVHNTAAPLASEVFDGDGLQHARSGVFEVGVQPAGQSEVGEVLVDDLVVAAGRAVDYPSLGASEELVEGGVFVVGGSVFVG